MASPSYGASRSSSDAFKLHMLAKKDFNTVDIDKKTGELVCKSTVKGRIYHTKKKGALISRKRESVKEIRLVIRLVSAVSMKN